MTLTGHIDEPARTEIATKLHSIFDPLLDEDFQIDALTLFEQKAPNFNFVVAESFPLRSRYPTEQCQ
ncbi:DUF1045 domain-containing protein [Mesorhizobium sp. IRAMC:0171]|uniref:DUF1045 domain-containing protein n=1 Tax=Mesorhizobium retamae TaxID=2912854 RepID=A0ABS9QDF5_9HYPH|nr:DUF1045 domain-containing protein [Mesorhizobium sp. IRAMC:0171]